MTVVTSGAELIHQGSVKEIYRVHEGILAFLHTDRFSVFDCGPHPQTIPGMGEALCTCTCASFKIAERLGVQTHFIRRGSHDSIDVREFQTIKDRALLPNESDCMIPLEWIDRSILAGSLLRDFAEGKKKPTDYGFPSNDKSALPKEGTPLPFPIHQVTTKWEKVDRALTKDEVLRLAGMSEEEWTRAWSIIDRLNGGLSLAAKIAGFTRLDGKKELAFSGPQRQIVVIDSFGNPHEDRYAPTDALIQGEVIHYSKEYLRQLFIDKGEEASGFFAQVKAARAAGKPDPEYPLLAHKEISEAERRFKGLALAFEKAVKTID